MQCYICLLYIPYFVNKCQIGCLDIIELALVENYAKKEEAAVIFPLAVLWPAYSVATKRLHICFFGLPAEMLGIWWLVI
jgi:uncharacterized membrane protein YhaH (DUF805 family)